MAQIKIEITYDPSKETLEQAVSSLTPKARPAEPAATAEPVKKTETVKDKPEGPASAAAPVKTEEPAADDKPAESSSEPAKKVSKTDVRAVATALSKAGKREELSAIFAEFGGKKLSDIKDEDYPALMEKLEAANG